LSVEQYLLQKSAEQRPVFLLSMWRWKRVALLLIISLQPLTGKERNNKKTSVTGELLELINYARVARVRVCLALIKIRPLY
jgi:hypothetical protein